MSRFKTTIGLEIHVQLMTKTKMFCSCKTNVLEAEPNTNICPVCTGQPGALPVTNEEAVKLAVKAALLLNAKINEVSRFDRKNYFYPDLPKGYQITQYFYPLAVQGYIEIDGKKIRIRRIHIEEDAGKLLHEGESIEKANYALVDYNRSGVPLIEIVTEPDIESPKEARAFMEKLRNIVRYADISTGDMEKGALRCDANISVLDTETGVRSNRVEVKNMNSFKFVEKALEYERDRIISYLEKGENVPQETRGWDMNSKRTFSMRGKEEEADYRYFPEPDLLPLIITQDYIEEIKKELPELADEKAERFVREYSIPEYDAKVLSADKDIAEYFEEAAKIVGDAKFVSNWMMTELLRELKERELNIKEVKIKPVHFKELKELISQGIISTSMAKKVFVEVVETGESPSKIVERKGLKKIDDTALIEEILKRVIKENPKTVKKYKNGKTSVLGFFVGQVMKETKGKADPKLVNEIAKKLLDEV